MCHSLAWNIDVGRYVEIAALRNDGALPDDDVLPDHAQLRLPAADHLLELSKIPRRHHPLHDQLVRLKNT